MLIRDFTYRWEGRRGVQDSAAAWGWLNSGFRNRLLARGAALGLFVMGMCCSLLADAPVRLLTPNVIFPRGGSGDSGQAAFSGDGRWVCFVSSAPNLVTNDDRQPWLDVFARDLSRRTTLLISANLKGSGGGDGNSISPQASSDGRYIVFSSEAQDLTPVRSVKRVFNVFWRDMDTGITRLVSVSWDGTAGADQPCENVQMSQDGRFVLFESAASNLVEGDDNRSNDIFLSDLVQGKMSIVNVDRNGRATGAIPAGSAKLSADGSRVLFLSHSTDLVEGGWRWRVIGEGDPPRPTLVRIFEPMTNRADQVYLRDVPAARTTWISSREFQLTGGAEGSDWPCKRPALSLDGTVAFYLLDDRMVIRCEVDRTNERDAWLARAFDYDSFTPTGLVPLGPLVVHPDAQMVGFECWRPQPLLASRDLSISHLYLFDFAQLEACPGVGGGGVGQGTVYCPKYWMASPGLPGRPDLLDGRSSALRFSRDGRSYFYVTDSRRISPELVGGAMALMRAELPSGLARSIPLRAETFLFEGELAEGFELSPIPGLLAVNSRLGLQPNSDREPWVNVHLLDIEADRSELVSARHPDLPDVARGDGFTLRAPHLSDAGDTVLLRRSDLRSCCGDSNGVPDLFLVEGLEAGAARLLPVTPFTRPRPFPLREPLAVTNRISFGGALQGAGRYVFYYSLLLPWSPTSPEGRLLRYDRMTGAEELVVDTADYRSGQEGRGLAIEVDSLRVDSRGDRVLFSAISPGSVATNLFLFQRVDPPRGKPATWSLSTVNSPEPGAVQPVSARVAGGTITANGKWVVFLNSLPLESNAPRDSVTGFRLYARELDTGRLIAPRSTDLKPRKGFEILRFHLSTNDTDVGFHSSLGQGYHFNLLTEALETVCTNCQNLALDGSGKKVVYEYLPDEPPLVRQVMLQDLVSGVTHRVSVRSGSQEWAQGPSFNPRLTPDGRFVLFVSRADDLVSGDSNGVSDVFLYDTIAGTNRLLSLNRQRTGSGQGPSANPVMSQDGSVVVFRSGAPDLVDSDLNDTVDDFFVRLLPADTDGDGLPDDWERSRFGSLERDGLGDRDLDGVSDGVEYLTGTDPTQKTSRFRGLDIGLGTRFGQEVFWSSVPGRYYQLQFTADPANPVWQDVGKPVLAHAATWSVYDPNITAETDRRFYRILLLPTAPR